MNIAERLAEIQANIATHAGGRPVTLVAVSKYATLAQVTEAYQAGVRHFGENKVQDALAKIEALPSEYQDVHWHFIGNLQSNKAKKTVGRFGLIHALDSVHQGQALSKANLEANLCQPVLLQVNFSGDESRHGVLPADVPRITEALLSQKGIVLRGLMTLAPAEASLNQDLPTLKRVFCGLAAMKDNLSREFGIDLPELSMGMSHDYVQALEWGATIIRIGNYLFQNR